MKIVSRARDHAAVVAHRVGEDVLRGRQGGDHGDGEQVDAVQAEQVGGRPVAPPVAEPAA